MVNKQGIPKKIVIHIKKGGGDETQVSGSAKQKYIAASTASKKNEKLKQ
jgi:hypothetical protein